MDAFLTSVIVISILITLLIVVPSTLLWLRGVEDVVDGASRLEAGPYGFESPIESPYRRAGYAEVAGEGYREGL